MVLFERKSSHSCDKSYYQTGFDIPDIIPFCSIFKTTVLYNRECEYFLVYERSNTIYKSKSLVCVY